MNEREISVRHAIHADSANERSMKVMLVREREPMRQANLISSYSSLVDVTVWIAIRQVGVSHQSSRGRVDPLTHLLWGRASTDARAEVLELVLNRPPDFSMFAEEQGCRRTELDASILMGRLSPNDPIRLTCQSPLLLPRVAWLRTGWRICSSSILARRCSSSFHDHLDEIQGLRFSYASVFRLSNVERIVSDWTSCWWFPIAFSTTIDRALNSMHRRIKPDDWQIHRDRISMVAVNYYPWRMNDESSEEERQTYRTSSFHRTYAWKIPIRNAIRNWRWKEVLNDIRELCRAFVSRRRWMHRCLCTYAQMKERRRWIIQS